jgi:hypothetical protein
MYARGMSPRRNRPRRGGGPPPETPAPPDLERVRRGVDAVESWGYEQWRVRQIPGSTAAKSYRCPGCDQEIPPGVPHLVVWPIETIDGSAGESARRHWHAGCWRARDRRRPTR